MGERRRNRFQPERLFPACINEILFGSGTFVMGTDSQSAANIIEREWSLHLDLEPLGPLFRIRHVSPQSIKLMVVRSPDFELICARAGYSLSDLQLMFTHAEQTKCVDKLKAACITWATE